MPLLDLGYVTLDYELSGPQAAPCVVLSSSLGATLDMWQPQLPALKNFRVLRYSMRGHGRSSVPQGPYSISNLGNDVLAMLDALQIEAVSFCGISIGGVIGQWLAANASRRITRLVLSNTAAKIGTVEGWNGRIAQVRAHGTVSIADATMARWFTEDFRTAHAEIVEQMRHTLASISTEGYVSCCAALREADQRELIQGITRPTLIIAGKYDPTCSVQDAREMQQAIAGSRVVVLPASHIANTNAASDFNAALVGFLNES